MVDSRPCQMCKRVLPIEQLVSRKNGWFCGACDDRRPPPQQQRKPEHREE